MATVPNKPAGNQMDSNFFANATANRVALVPGAAMLAGMGNASLGRGSARVYNSLVAASQQNGAGPAIAPIQAPFSVTQFGTGKRVLSLAIARKIKGK